MMVRVSLGILLGFALVNVARADLPIATFRPVAQHPWSTPAAMGCPNDYVRGPMPSICPLPRCGSVDDYCRKPMPCVPALPRCGTPDDYCRRPLPCLLCLPPNPYLQCVPSERCIGTGHGR